MGPVSCSEMDLLREEELLLSPEMDEPKCVAVKA